MPEISRQQKQYLARQKKEKHIILAARTLLFVLFMGLWEISSDLGWIDSFIFSSPSKITLCFLEMLKNRSLFLHIGITLYETFISFILVILLSILAAILLWYSKKLSEILEPNLVVLPTDRTDPGAMSGGTEQSPEICSGPSSDRMARRNFKNNYYCRNVRRHLRKYLESVYRLYQCRSGKDQTDIYTARKPQACAYKSCTAFLCSGNHKQYESQYRTLSCGSHYRRISRCQKRTWISDHLFQSGI